MTEHSHGEKRKEIAGKNKYIEVSPRPLTLLNNNFFFFFLGLYLCHMEVPRLGVKSELQLPACATATATPDLSHLSDLHRSSQQQRIL